MLSGWTGIDLEVDLSRGKITKKESSQQLREAYLGGKGTGVKLLWDRVPPEVDPSSPDNLLIFGAGVLAGTIAPGANRTCITYKSPMTNSYSYSSMGGFWASELKYAGYDTIVISGKSSTPVYLWINDGHAEICNASHLWGKDTCETQRAIREELGKADIQTLCISLAGENKVYAATVEDGTGASASRGGGGAIMGDKNLKAIAVHGTKDVSISKPYKLVKLCEHILSRTDRIRSVYFENWAFTMFTGGLRVGAYGNWDGVPPSEEEIKELGKMCDDFIKERRIREVGCYNCGLRCKHVYARPDGGYSFVKCQSLMTPMIVTRVFDCDFALAFSTLCEKYGLDIASVGSYVAFTIDLYERGILTREDTDGMHLEWGNPEVAFSLIEKIARREGIGNVLAHGVYSAARQIGKGAEEHAYHVKKLDLIPYQKIHPNVALAQCISDKADSSRLNSDTLTRAWLAPKEEREAFVKSGYFAYPKEYEKYFLAGWDPAGADYEGLCQFVAYDEQTWALADSIGLCMIWSTFTYLPTIESRAVIADLISCVTGIDIDETEATKIGKRIAILARAYSVRAGQRRKDDRLPKGFFQVSPPPPLRKLDASRINDWVDRLYEIKGCNREGIPTKETLQELGLDYVTQDLERRGIL